MSDVAIKGLANARVHEGCHLGLEEVLDRADRSFDFDEVAEVGGFDVLKNIRNLEGKRLMRKMEVIRAQSSAIRGREP